ncbi:MarR family transcriptional regulator [Halococcus salsus]|uniref:DUF7839 domain-containing protein n=1 Tax=Halococcus salsus TaxID=2162894 RepID=UPI0013571CFE|nr:MarR family transcriptional regulator [Halococcus salsus]
MPTNADEASRAGVLESKRNATRYQILVEVADRQPAVSQREIADAIGVTAQAVSEYLGGLAEEGYVAKHGRGRYEVTKEGVDWLLSQTDDLRGFIRHVTEDVVGRVEVETAVATTEIAADETVSLAMRDGVLSATAGEAGSATAVAITDAEPGQDVGVTEFEGLVEHEVGSVTAVSVPGVQRGGSSAVDPTTVTDLAEDHDLVATAGTEALATARAAGVDVDIRFATAPAVREAATKGLDVLVLATADLLSAHTDELRQGGIGYEVVDVGS